MALVISDVLKSLLSFKVQSYWSVFTAVHMLRLYIFSELVSETTKRHFELSLTLARCKFKARCMRQRHDNLTVNVEK